MRASFVLSEKRRSRHHTSLSNTGWYAMSLVVVIIAVAINVISGIFFWKAFYAQRLAVLHQWADAEGYQIVHCERRWWRRGPFAWGTSQYQVVYYMTVVGQDGKRHIGWACCGSWWGQSPEPIEVKWERRYR